MIYQTILPLTFSNNQLVRFHFANMRATIIDISLLLDRYDPKLKMRFGLFLLTFFLTTSAPLFLLLDKEETEQKLFSLQFVSRI